MNNPVAWREAQLRAISDLTADIRLFELVPSGGFVAPAPGSHINVTVQIDGRPVTRSYSIVGPCLDGVYRIAVKRLPDSRGGSVYMWTLQPGMRLQISEPGNHFELAHGRSEYLLIAGGIGITPIYTMALALAAAGAKFRLLYACRSASDLAFGAELEKLLGDRLQAFLDDAGQRINLAAEIAGLLADGEAYVCGPIGMLEGVRQAWAQTTRPAGNLRFETFGNSGRYAISAFRVIIPRLGKTIDVARNQTMLEALETAGVDMISDCRRGECGLCALKIVSMDGAIDHRDVFFSDAEKASSEKLCTCVSRMAGGSITVDTGDRSL